MDKKTILALIVVGIIFLLWPVYMKKVVGVKELEKKPVPRTEQQISSEDTATPAISQTFKDEEKAGNSRTDTTSGDRDNTTPTDADTLIIETDTFKGKLSSLGGGTIVSWKLKKYLKPGTEKEHIDDQKNWVELMPKGAKGDLGLSMGWRDLSQIPFAIEYDTLGEIKKYKFVHQFEEGGRIEKEFSVVPESYQLVMTVRLVSLTRNEVGEGYSVYLKSGLMPTEGEKRIREDIPYYQAWALFGKKLIKTKGDTTTHLGDTKWIAVRTKYFISAIIPIGTQGRELELSGNKATVYKENDWKTFTARLEMPFNGSFDETHSFKIYIGPMDYSLMQKQGSDLHKIMFGRSILKPFSIAFLYVLQFIFGIVKNYGLAIIIFSILIKLVLYPLTRKSFQSMRQMQELQPKIAALKEKHKKDSQKLNQETMKLYKAHGVNPMGGCLPMLFQMPVLIALFTLFRTTIILRQASFLAIKDLSAPDAIFGAGLNLLPILMGATMIIQQKLSNTNPQQKAMAYMMPIFFGFIFYKMSAGLNLYYLMFNLLTIAQEMLIKRNK